MKDKITINEGVNINLESHHYQEKQGTSYPMPREYVSMVEGQIRSAFCSGYALAEPELKNLREALEKILSLTRNVDDPAFRAVHKLAFEATK